MQWQLAGETTHIIVHPQHLIQNIRLLANPTIIEVGKYTTLTLKTAPGQRLAVSCPCQTRWCSEMMRLPSQFRNAMLTRSMSSRGSPTPGHSSSARRAKWPADLDLDLLPEHLGDALASCDILQLLYRVHNAAYTPAHSHDTRLLGKYWVSPIQRLCRPHLEYHM